MVFPSSSSSSSPADAQICVRSKSSILLDNRLKELQETLRHRTSNFHVRVSVPGELCRACRHHKCHSCLPVQHHQRQKDDLDLPSSLGDRNFSHGNGDTETPRLPISKHPSSQTPKLGLNPYQKISLLHGQLKTLPPNQWGHFNSFSGNVSQDFTDTTKKFDGHEKWKPAVADRKSDNENEYDTNATISNKLSTLKNDVKSFWKGHRSPRQRLELLRQRHDTTQAKIQSLEEEQAYLKEKILDLEKKSRERNMSLEKTRLNRIRTMEKAKDSCSNSREQRALIGTRGNAIVSDESSAVLFSNDSKEVMKITEFWTENNCEFHVNRIINSLRQVAAFEILEFCHKRLSSHLMDHLSASYQELQSEEKKSSYVRMFGFLDETEQRLPTTFPLEISYAELLDFVQQQMHEGKRVKKELSTALKHAERKLLEDAEDEGYSRNLVGDIRWQMTGFKVLEGKFGNIKYYHYYCTNTESTATALVKLEDTKDVVEDILRTAEQGDLGVLERATKLIRLGCYFLERRRLLNPPTAAQELDSLENIDAAADSQSE